MADLPALSLWASHQGIPQPAPLQAAQDFGRCQIALPALVLQPQDEAQLVDCVRQLAERGQPYTLRGAGHSSGSQPLSDGGVILDITRLCRILQDDPQGETITVQGGASWLQLVNHLEPQGRRPLCLTTGFRATVAGTLAVGGFGDTTHLHGLVISGVLALVLLTPDGTRHSVRRGDPLFEYALAGLGQLGIILEVTLRTLRRPIGLIIKSASWFSVPDYLRDALVIAELGLFEFLRARTFFLDGRWVAQSIFGHLVDTDAPDPEVDIEPLRPAAVSEPGRVLLQEHLREDKEDKWPYACPALEVAFALPEGAALWPRFAQRIVETGLVRYLDHGAAIMLVPRQSAPLAPVPPSDYSFLVALRPQLPPDEVAALLPAIRTLGQEALAMGARLYRMSVEPDQKLVNAQYGAALATWQSLKRAVDPRGLCNPGLLSLPND